MQHRASFVLDAAGQLVISVLDFIGIWALATRFGHISGWNLYEVSFIYGIVGVSFACAEAASYGFDYFGTFLKNGDFDRILLRPWSAPLQLAGHELTLRRIGKLAQALVVLLWAIHANGTSMTGMRAALTIASIIGGICLFCGLFILQATVTFWTTEGLEVFNVFTYGGRETAQVPIVIYEPWLRRFFTYVVPVAAVTYFPAALILGKIEPLGTNRIFQATSPLLGVVFLLISLRLWKVGERRYCSTGS
jgi:ABC-2 type transport system permease protein